VSVDTEDIRSGLRALGLSGVPICVHSSLRSIGWVEGGAGAVIDAVLAEGCTLLVPTFSDAFFVSPPADPALRPPRNGYDFIDLVTDKGVQQKARVFTIDTLEIDRDMGAIPAAVLSIPGHVRGNHPLCSFSALGPRAKELVESQTPGQVFMPLRKLAALGGFILLIGVDLTSMTLIHLAEQFADRSLFKRWALESTGAVIMADCGGCSDGFNQLEPILSTLRSEANVGESRWQAFPATGVIEAAAAAIREDPRITHCDDPDCARCNDAIAGGPIL
jgi:aminoglycoside N3'-acetyltransferase